MKFPIKHRWNGSVIFDAEIQCEEETPYGIKLGLAIKVAILSRVDLSDANLARADLSRVDLSDANLSGANLSWANLSRAVGNMRNIKSLQLEDYAITYTATHMHIGCQAHAFEEWWGFDDDEIEEMDGRKALQFWRKWKPVLQQIIALSPAEPTGYVEEEELRNDPEFAEIHRRQMEIDAAPRPAIVRPGADSCAPVAPYVKGEKE